jgi:putative PEP-CTERM system histidine kinase
LAGVSLNATLPEEVARWQWYALLAESFLPISWLCFSLTYSRGNSGEFLKRWRFVLLAAFLIPVGLSVAGRGELVHPLPEVRAGHGWWLSLGPATKALNAVLLIAIVAILTNLEKTLRAAVGTMQWRIKFVVVGLGLVFGARIYTASQALLFSGQNLGLTAVQAGALLIGCTLMAIAYGRRGFAEIDIYPSRAVLHTSVTVLLAGGYFLVVGVLAQVVALLGGTRNFQLQALVVLVGIAVMAVLLLSGRLRQRIQDFVSRHFKRPQHDFRKVWTLFTQRMSSIMDEAGLCMTAAKLISETFNVLSVHIWVLDEPNERFVCRASTSELPDASSERDIDPATSSLLLTGLQEFTAPFDLDTVKSDWAERLRQANPCQFRTGGHRICIPLRVGDRWLGFGILADRINAVPYTIEERDLLNCIADQIAAGLLKLLLTEELMLANELKAFQTVSAFFVHDLKNAASTLSLMLQNLPVHFDNPAFRQDALRGIAKTVDRVNQLIGRLGLLRDNLELKIVPSDLNQLVLDALQAADGAPEVEWVKELQPLPKIAADNDQLQTVLTNLLLNARDAVGPAGRITVRTSRREDKVMISVTDNGCGMSPNFLKKSLFRPFHTTKKKGVGIGMFQSKMIVEAHRGSIQVESEPGKGTTFRVMLPIQPETA